MSIEYQVRGVASTEGAADSGAQSAESHGLGLRSEILQPLLQGARARGFADALEALGQAAVLLDACGVALHLTSRARRLVGQGVELVGGHLVGTCAGSNQRISELIGFALAGKTGESLLSPEPGGLKARILSLGAEFESPFQMVKAVILLEPAP